MMNNEPDKRFELMQMISCWWSFATFAEIRLLTAYPRTVPNNSNLYVVMLSTQFPMEMPCLWVRFSWLRTITMSVG